ncbi:hypothetical protein [Oxalicibacterium flavum]|nr:hypothetical protein [Oxalicibacterium flavum]
MHNANGAGVIEASTNSLVRHMPATIVPPRSRIPLPDGGALRTAA